MINTKPASNVTEKGRLEIDFISLKLSTFGHVD
jgi:hypothetical protein